MVGQVVALNGAEPVSTNPILPLWTDYLSARRSPVPFPAGDTNLSIPRTRAMMRDPLSMLLDGYRRHGPVFTVRLLTSNVVVLLGPEANHHLLVSNARNFSWRHGSMGNLIPLLGDGLLTIDGDFHRRSRKIMLPAFGSKTIAASLETMALEIDTALDGWRDGQQVDLYEWTRNVALRIAMRALFGVDPDGPLARRFDAVHLFEQALRFYSYDPGMQMLRGPRTPWRRMHEAREQLDRMIYGEIAERRRSGERGLDLLSLLLDARDEDDGALSDALVRDEVMTMLFAGHDTTTSTISFLFYELLRAPEWIDRLRAEHEAVAGKDGKITAAQYMAGELPLLDQVLDETLRLYPPAWVGPRRSIDPFEVCGVRVPGGVPVLYSSWVSHQLPDVWDAPARFRPERFAPDERAKIPKGAYVPFGGGSRSCIGMRFGQLEIRALATEALRRFDFTLQPGYQLRIRQQPTIGPADGLPLTVRTRA